MFTRRSLGPAYERSPAERFSDWSHRNLLTLGAAVLCVFLFWVAVNFLVDNVLNTITQGSSENIEIRFYSDHPLAIGVKVVGGLLIVIGLIKSRAK